MISLKNHFYIKPENKNSPLIKALNFTELPLKYQEINTYKDLDLRILKKFYYFSDGVRRITIFIRSYRINGIFFPEGKFVISISDQAFEDS